MQGKSLFPALMLGRSQVLITPDPEMLAPLLTFLEHHLPEWRARHCLCFGGLGQGFNFLSHVGGQGQRESKLLWMASEGLQDLISSTRPSGDTPARVMQMVAAEAETLEAAGSQGFLREAEHLRDGPGSTEKALGTRLVITVLMHHGIRKQSLLQSVRCWCCTGGSGSGRVGLRGYPEDLRTKSEMGSPFWV